MRCRVYTATPRLSVRPDLTQHSDISMDDESESTPTARTAGQIFPSGFLDRRSPRNKAGVSRLTPSVTRSYSCDAGSRVRSVGTTLCPLRGRQRGGRNRTGSRLCDQMHDRTDILDWLDQRWSNVVSETKHGEQAGLFSSPCLLCEDRG